MAKVALAVAGGVIGGIVGGPAGAIQGASIGLSLGSFLFHPKSKHLPPLQDLQVSSSADGAAIPFGYVQTRFAGQLIWTSGIKFVTQNLSAKGGPTSTIYIYNASFAAAFCEGPAVLVRVWADSKLIYKNPLFPENHIPLQDVAVWDAATYYYADDVVAYPDTLTGLRYVCTLPNSGQVPGPASPYWQQTSEYPGWDSATQYSPGAIVDFWGVIYACIKANQGHHPDANPSDWSPLDQYYKAPVMYVGDELQTPDSLIQADRGVPSTPAFRGICYAVWDTFPLANFGNRIPNIRAEVLFGQAGGTPAVPGVTVAAIGGSWFAQDVGPFAPIRPGPPVAIPLIYADDSHAFFSDGAGGYAFCRGRPGGGAPHTRGVWTDFQATAAVPPPVGPDSEFFIIGPVSNRGTEFAFPNGFGGYGDSTERYWYDTEAFAINGAVGTVVAASGAGPTISISNGPFSLTLRKNGSANWAAVMVVAGSTCFVMACSDDGFFVPPGWIANWYAPQFWQNLFPGALPSWSLALVYRPPLTGSLPLTTQSQASLADAVSDLCLRAGLDPTTQVDVSLLAGPLSPVSLLRGYLVERPTQASTAIKALMQAYFFDACESDGKIKFIPRALALTAATTGPKIVQSKFVEMGVLPNTGIVTLNNPPVAGNLLLGYGVFRGPEAGGSGVDIEIRDSVGNIWTPLYRDASRGFWICRTKAAASLTAYFIYHGVATAYDAGGGVIEISGSPSFADAIATGTGPVSVTLGGDVFAVPGMFGGNWAAALVDFPDAAAGNRLSIAMLIDFAGAFYSLPAGWTSLYSQGRTQIVYKYTATPGSLPAGALGIPEDDLGLVADKAKLEEHQVQEQDLPRSVTVLYNDPALDYQQGKQMVIRSDRIMRTKQQDRLELPMTLLGIEARRIADVELGSKSYERIGYDMNLWRALYLLLDPTDIVQFVYENAIRVMRVVENSLGQGYATKLQGVRVDERTYFSGATAAAHVQPTGGLGLIVGPSLLWLFDLPLLRDSDANFAGTGYYWAAYSAAIGWPGAVLYQAPGGAVNTALLEGSSHTPVEYGATTTVLGAPRSPWTWDTVNTVTVQMIKGTLAGATDLAVLNGANPLVVGNELIQFANAVQNMDGTYTLSRLLRGRRGTEWACGSHVSGETVVNPYVGLLRKGKALSIVNSPLSYGLVTIGQDPATAAIQAFTDTGNDLKPYAPTSIAGARDGSNNLTLDWIRRTRIGGDWLDGQGTVPLSEDSEAYEVDIMNGGTAVRTITGLSSPTASYSAADQTTDFGSAQSAIAVRVYQISGEVGRGFRGSATV